MNKLKENRLMKNQVMCTIHFTDGDNLKLAWEEKDGDDTIIASRVRNAIEKDKFVFESNGDLIIVPTQNIKYIYLTPGPKALPKDLVIGDVSIVS
jgi:hypothetical protein